MPQHSPAAAAKSLQSCLTLCDPIDGSPPGSSIQGIFQARLLEWGAFAFSLSTPLLWGKGPGVCVGGGYRLKGKAAAKAYPLGLCSSILGADPTPDRVVMATKQRGTPTSPHALFFCFSISTPHPQSRWQLPAHQKESDWYQHEIHASP